MSRLIISEQTTTPSTPSSGKVAIYAKVDGYLYSMDDTGVEVPLSGGGENLAATLGFGNATSGHNIELSAGDEIAGEASSTGHVVLHAGTPGVVGDGARVDLIPGAGFGGGNPGTIRFWDETQTNYVDVLVTGSDALRMGGTYQLTYDGTSGAFYAKRVNTERIQLTEVADAVPPAGTGVMFVSDGSGMRTAGHLYLHNSSGYYDLVSPTVPAATLQTAYDAGALIILSGVASPVVIRSAGTGEVLQLRTPAGNILLKLKDNLTAAQLQAGEGAAGAAGLDLDLLGGSAGAGNQNGGNVNIRPGAKTGTGLPGTIAFGDYDGGSASVKAFVSGSGYPAPVMRSVPGAGSFGMVVGPFIQLSVSYSFPSPLTTYQLDGNVSCLFVTSTEVACFVNLPLSPIVGQTVTIKDITPPTSPRTNFTIKTTSGSIDGMASTPVTASFQSYTFVSDGTDWYII